MLYTKIAPVHHTGATSKPFWLFSYKLDYSRNTLKSKANFLKNWR